MIVDWDWFYLSSNVNINDIRKYPTLPWDVYGIACNPNIKIRDLLDLGVNISNWEGISLYIDINEVISNPNLPWVRDRLSSNKGINEYVVEELDMPNAIEEWDMDELSMYAPMDYILKHPDYAWNTDYIARNEELKVKHIPIFEQNGYDCHLMKRIIGTFINIQEVWDNPSYKWDRSNLSRNSGITMNLINNLELPNAVGSWQDDRLLEVLPIQDIRDNKSFFSKYLSTFLVFNPGIQIIDLNCFEPDDLNWYGLSGSINIMEVRKYPHLPWDKEGLSMNSAITIEDVFYLGYPRPKVVIGIENYPLYWDISILYN